jgi:uncharacterized membrane protein YfcA
MKKAFLFGGGTLGSYAGWYLGEAIDSFSMSILFSIILGIAGLVATWKLLQQFS